MAGRVTGKVALITGGGGGIGQASAELLWAEGASVVLVDVDAGEAERAAAEIDPSGERALAIGAHLDDETQAQRAVDETVRKFGRLDILANVAGVRVWGPVTEADPASWDYVIRGNLLQVGYCSKFAVPAMSETGGGSIINVSSANALAGRPGMAQYDATKAALLALTRSMAHDHAGLGIRVNAVCPGPTLTTFHVRRRAASTGETLEEAREALSTGTPTLLRRQADPKEIGYAILFLGSDEASYVTGATLMVDGGLSA
ncbi:SDR family NAD(P)-dependent oxidoreductase [Actinopolymorpha alba]|uniref:SDR family NAD(P)-dependent oxidoreductase n=1 Tax=Actinopolymorpha alba TaxID=533267 RepID=UPI00035D7D7C|nr:glucose 1-dehydrogenase [Actinopolymorpha alba]